jgi:hypothetical protein
VAHRYLLTVDTDYDPPEVSVEVFEDFAAHERARKATAKRERELAKAAKLAAEAKAKAERAEAEVEHRANVEHLAEMVSSASQQVATVVSLPNPSSMVEYRDGRDAWASAERAVKSAMVYAMTKGIEEPTVLRSLIAKLGPCKARLGA